MNLRQFDAESDLEVCEQIFRRAWNQALPKRPREATPTELRVELTDERVWVAELGDRVIGFSSVWEPDAFLHHLYIDPRDHGRGAGSMLLLEARAFSGERKLRLKCLVENERAMRFYRSRGFREDGETGEDSLGKWVSLRDAHDES